MLSHTFGRLFVSAALAIGMLTFASIANASTFFDFSFQNEDGSVGGEVAGRIELPAGDGTFAAIELAISSAPAALGYSLPIGLGDFASVTENTFTVTGGLIDPLLSHFFGIFPGFNTAFALNGTDFAAGGISFLDQNPVAFLGVPGVLDSDNSSLTYSSVPESSTLILLSLGLAGIGVARRRKGAG